jgi:hypothetical protein
MVLLVIEKNTPSKKNKTATNKTETTITNMPFFVRSRSPDMPVAQKSAMATTDHIINF